jgi:hypothetical protein
MSVLVRTEGDPRDQRLRAVSAQSAPQLGRKTEEAAQMTRERALVRGGRQGHRQPTEPQVSSSVRRPLIAREMTSCWICSVPSKMSQISRRGR